MAAPQAPNLEVFDNAVTGMSTAWQTYSQHHQSMSTAMQTYTQYHQTMSEQLQLIGSQPYGAVIQNLADSVQALTTQVQGLATQMQKGFAQVNAR
jgi:uncharacterized protein YoxC